MSPAPILTPTVLAAAKAIMEVIVYLVAQLKKLGVDCPDLVAATDLESARIRATQAGHEAAGADAMGLPPKGPTL